MLNIDAVVVTCYMVTCRWKRGYKNVIGKGIELNREGTDTPLMMETRSACCAALCCAVLCCAVLAFAIAAFKAPCRQTAFLDETNLEKNAFFNEQ